MIRSLTGTIVSHQETSVVLTVHSIGYLIYTPAKRYGLSMDTEAHFYTHLAVRETALDLYGFLSQRELEYFELLLTIPKIGPKSALQIMCQADPDLLATAILTDDAEHLHTVAGIGKKTAANIVLHLAGKIDPTHGLGQNLQKAPLTLLSSSQNDAIDALITLGYEAKEARDSVLRLDNSLDAKSLIQAVLKQAPMA